MAAVTQINATYLNRIKGDLQTILDQVKKQLTDPGGATSFTLPYIPPISSTSLAVQAGTTDFDAGTALNAALKTVGGSVNDQLEWLKKTLTDMISEITTTVNSFKKSETLNNEAVSKLITDFQNTIDDINGGTGSSTSTASSST